MALLKQSVAGLTALSCRAFLRLYAVVGPDANSGLRSFILDETPGLVVRHPDTLEFIPELANEWALAG